MNLPAALRRAHDLYLRADQNPALQAAALAMVRTEWNKLDEETQKLLPLIAKFLDKSGGDAK